MGAGRISARQLKEKHPGTESFRGVEVFEIYGLTLRP